MNSSGDGTPMQTCKILSGVLLLMQVASMSKNNQTCGNESVLGREFKKSDAMMFFVSPLPSRKVPRAQVVSMSYASRRSSGLLWRGIYSPA